MKEQRELLKKETQIKLALERKKFKTKLELKEKKLLSRQECELASLREEHQEESDGVKKQLKCRKKHQQQIIREQLEDQFEFEKNRLAAAYETELNDGDWVVLEQVSGILAGEDLTDE